MDDYLTKYLKPNYSVKGKYSLYGNLDATTITFKEFKNILSHYDMTHANFDTDYGLFTIKDLHPIRDKADGKKAVYDLWISHLDGKAIDYLIDNFPSIFHHPSSVVNFEFNTDIYPKLSDKSKVFIDLVFPNRLDH